MQKLHLPCVQGCSLNSPLIDSETLVRELIFTYKCNNPCKHCHMLCRNNRTMNPQLAVNIVKDSIDYARQNGYKKLAVCLIGAEVLDAFDELKEFYEHLTMIDTQIPVSILIETCHTSISEECKKWLSDAKNIYLSLRTDSPAEQFSDEIDFSQYYSICQRISRNDFSDIFRNTVVVLDKFPIGVTEYFPLGRLDKNDYEEYCKQLHLLKKHNLLESFTASDFSNCCSPNNSAKQIETIDTDGKKYFCKYMSPAYNLSSIYKKVSPNNDIPLSCNECQAKDCCSLCPAARVLKSNSQCQILRRQYKAYCLSGLK